MTPVRGGQRDWLEKGRGSEKWSRKTGKQTDRYVRQTIINTTHERKDVSIQIRIGTRECKRMETHEHQKHSRETEKERQADRQTDRQVR